MSRQLPHTSVIVAVGRSGTTIMHRLLLEVYADLFADGFDILYEPFVWDSDVIGRYPMDKPRELMFGRQDALSQEGLYLHTRLPLFLGADVEPQLEALVGRYLRSQNDRPLLAKYIRANGRLSLLDRLYPDGRFILCLRNPFDVVNSVLTKFSFFGSEFHKNDYPRFIREVRRRFGVELPPEEAATPAHRAALWCHFMNLAALKHAAQNERYRIVVYEDFVAHREAYARQICEHIGAPYRAAYDGIVANSVGRVSGERRVLSSEDVGQIEPFFEKYISLVAPLPKFAEVDAQRIVSKYMNRPAGRSYVPRGLGWSPVRLESEVLSQRERIQNAERGYRAGLAEVQRRTLAAECRSVAAKPDVSVVVASYNNARTVARAIASIRAQSYSISEIIVADDASTDGSRELLAAVAKEEPRLRLLLRERNIGVSANRNDAIRSAQAPFVSQIDGDDAFHHAKIEREVRALQGREDSIAFSDTIKLDPEEYWDCSWVAGRSGRDIIASLVARRAALPRDMLLSKSLFLSAGGYREGCSMYEDWGFKVRVAEKARHWLYSGAEGTLYSPGGLSRVGRVNHVYGGLWILCNDVAEVVARNRCWTAALAGLLKLMKVPAEINFEDERLEDVLGAKIEVIFDDARRTLLDRPVSAYAADESAFFKPLQRMLAVLGITA